MIALDRYKLVEQAKRGDAEAFDRVTAPHIEMIFRLALRMLGQREEAEDVVQETLISAYRRLETFRGDADFGTWLYAIACKLCLKRRQHNARRERYAEERVYLQATPSDDPEMHLLVTQEAEEVQEALMALAPADRLLIVMKLIEGFSHEEIAGVLHCSVESSRARLLRAKKLFKERFLCRRGI